MKLKDLMERYGDYEIREFDFEEAFHRLDNDDDISGICIDVLKKKPTPKSIWDLVYGDKFISINAFGDITENCIWEDTVFDEEMRSAGNVFLTKEEASKEVDRRKVETLLLKYGGHRWARKDVNYRFGLQYNMVVICKDMYPLQGAIYFDLEQEAQKAINEIGADRIKDALFEVR